MRGSKPWAAVPVKLRTLPTLLTEAAVETKLGAAMLLGPPKVLAVLALCSDQAGV